MAMNHAMNHAMVDIETFDTKPSAIILSVAIVLFDPITGDYNTLMNCNLDAHSQIAMGRTLDEDTIKWWIGQNMEAKKRAFIPDVTINIASTKEKILEIVNQITVQHLWANGPDFDFTVLRDFVGYDVKWPFWKHRCVRTLKKTFPEYCVTTENDFMPHDPEKDCIEQINQVTHILQQSRSTLVYSPVG